MRHGFLIIMMTIFSSLFCVAQEHKINGTITGLENENLYLMQIMGEKRSIIDTVKTDVTGSFTFVMPESRLPGMYVIIKGKGQAVDFVYNNEDVQFITSGFNSNDGIQVVSSIENLIYYDYLSIKGLNMYKIDVLKTFIGNYPPNDDFYLDAVNEVKLLEKELNNRIDKLVNNNPNTLAASFLKADRPVFADVTLTDFEQNLFLKNHYFDGIDFNDTMLIRSTFLTSKVVNYLSLYQMNANSQAELEVNMLMGVDSILSYAQSNQQVYEFLIDFLISGFESIGFEKGLEHIANASTLNQFCENTERKMKLENKLELIKKLAIGQPAPNFTATDILGNKVVLNEITAKRTILVFWASWCPHCEEIMPVINSYYNGSDTYEVITISIDDSEEALMESLKESNYNWINIAEFKGWEGPIVEEYGIVATPSIFVLDENKKIIAKPVGKRDLDKFLKE